MTGYKRTRPAAVYRISMDSEGISYEWSSPQSLELKISKKKNEITIPGTELSYIEESRNYKSEEVAPVAEKSKNESSTENYKHIIRTIKRLRAFNIIFIALLFSAWLMVFNTILVVVPILGLLGLITIRAEFKIRLEYSFEDSARFHYLERSDALTALNKCNLVWSIKQQSGGKYKIKNAESDDSLSRKEVKIRKHAPYYIKSNKQIFSVKINGRKIYFLPDVVLIVKSFKAKTAEYKDVKTQLKRIAFVEVGHVTKDTEVSSYTWKYINEEGNKEKTAENNLKLPVVKYGEVNIRAAGCFDVLLLCSDYEKAKIFVEKFNSNLV